MAKRSRDVDVQGDAAYIDVDTTTLKPSPQRIRNILTLEERVAAIKAYECRPMYTKVAKMFNCSWEQIKNIIANRQAILDFYEATKNAERETDAHNDDVRQRKIEFLGECVYEYIQRLQFHTKADINEELIRSKAYEFRDAISIDAFTPNKAWINHFKATYNFSLSNRQITLTRSPPSSLELRDVMTFCTKQKLQRTQSNGGQSTPSVNRHDQHQKINHSYRTSTKMALSHENDATAEEIRQRRQRKLNFLERALIEYTTRAKFHLKVTLDDELLCSTAATLRDMLKIDNFQPNRYWLKSFKARYDFDNIVLGNLASTSTRTPPLSLDLKDILSYCSRLEKNSQISAADGVKSRNGGTKSSPTISVVPKSILMPMSSTNDKTFGDTNVPVQLLTQRGQRVQRGPPTSTTTPTPSPSLKDLHRPLCEFKREIIDLEDDDNEHRELHEYSESHDDDRAIPSSLPPLKIRKIESMCVNRESEHKSRDTNDNQLPKTVRNYEDALKLLKPLEEFAMLEENFRAIGLLEQLESLFKNPPLKHDDED